MNKNHYLLELSGSPRTHYGKIEFSEQGHEQKIFSAIWELLSLVNDGGFQGYFGNVAESSGFASIALRAIGARQCEAIVEAALALVPEPFPTEQYACWEIMHSLPESIEAQFTSLDEKFFADPDKLIDRLFAFVASHPDVFGSTPTDI